MISNDDNDHISKNYDNNDCGFSLSRNENDIISTIKNSNNDNNNSVDEIRSNKQRDNDIVTIMIIKIIITNILIII